MNPRFKDKKVVVTGAGRNEGIGKSIALAFAREGADVVITYNSQAEEAQQVLSEINDVYKKQGFSGCKAQALKVDLTEEKQRDQFVAEAWEFLGGVEILVNNAGVIDRKPVLDTTKADDTRVFDINVMAPIALCRSFGKKMQEQQTKLAEKKEFPKEYSMINITSISREVVTPGLALYEASKAALHAFTKNIAVEFAKYNICVNEIAPGLVPTNINSSMRRDNPAMFQQRVDNNLTKKPVRHESVAKAVLDTVENRDMIGSVVVVDSGRSLNWYGGDIHGSLQPNNVAIVKNA